MKSTRFLTRISLVAVLLGSSVAVAIKVPTGTDNFTLNVTVLLQPRVGLSWDGDRPTQTAGAAPNGTVDTDFYIRRARLYTTGTAFKYFTFYIMLDQPNLGIRGNYTGNNASAFVQDIHVGWEPNPNFDLEAGFLYMPLSHLAIDGAGATSSLEKPSAILLYNSNRGLRETGVQIRTLLFDRRFYFRGGIYEGMHGLQGADPVATAPSGIVNPNGRPLAAGMARVNLIGYETGYTFPSIYIDGKTHVSIGIGGQYQPKGSNTPVTTGVNAATGAPVITNTKVNDYYALAGDVFVDVALPGDSEAVLQADVYRFDWGSGSNNTGYAATGEVGYRWGPIEPEANFYWFNSESHRNSFLKVAGGANYFFKAHQVKLSAEFASVLNNVDFRTANALHQITVQFQMFF